MKTRSEARAEREAKKTEEEPKPEKKIDVDPATLPSDPFDFPSANASKNSSKLRGDLEQIVEKIFITDLFETWQKLAADMKLGEKRTDYATLHKAVDEVQEKAHLAFRLFQTAKLERDRWERENDTIWGAMWSEATKSIQAEKNSGSRSKQVTDADIKARVATIYPDEYQEIEHRRAHIKATVDTLEDLAKQWGQRRSSLEAMKNTLRA